MEASARPVLMARFYHDDKGRYLETQTARIELNADTRLMNHLLRLCNGHHTLAEIAALEPGSEFGERYIGELLDGLVIAGACFEAHGLGQLAQQLTCWPDPVLVTASEELVWELRQLPADPEGEFTDLEGLFTLPRHIAGRQTTRALRPDPLSLRELAAIAGTAYGFIEPTEDGFLRRTVPSAGAMYPLIINYLVAPGSELEAGIYRQALHCNGLIRLGDFDPDRMTPCFFEPVWQRASMTMVIGFDIGRSSGKYFARAQRFALTEAGAVAGRASDTAACLGIGVWPFGGYHDAELAKLLQIPTTGGIATVTFFGRPE